MSTNLELCKALCREAGISGGESAIAAVSGQTGELSRVVSGIRRAWTELQIKHISTGQYWRWMRASFTLTTIAGIADYSFNSTAIKDDLTNTQIDVFRKWMVNDDDDNPAQIYLTSGGVGGERPLFYMDWDDFQYEYRRGTQNSSFPRHISVNPQNQIVIGPVPNEIYTVSGDFLRGAQDLTADDDVPNMPADFHYLLVWLALTRYGLFESATEAVTSGEHYASMMEGALEGDQLSEMEMEGALV